MLCKFLPRRLLSALNSSTPCSLNFPLQLPASSKTAPPRRRRPVHRRARQKKSPSQAADDEFVTKPNSTTNFNTFRDKIDARFLTLSKKSKTVGISISYASETSWMPVWLA